MVSALGNGVKGGKWFSLMDKVIRTGNPGSRVAKVSRGTKGRRAWMARASRRFAAQAERYLRELQTS